MTDTPPSRTGQDDAWYRDTDALVETLQLDRQDPTALGLDAYTDLVEIRRGAQGVVHSAVARHTGDRVAIKVLHANPSEQSRLRFLREIELVGQLRHPYVVGLIDRGETPDGRGYFVMPFIAGQPLHEFVGDRAQSRAEIDARLDLFLKICEAVSYAHQRGVIHRDLKPSNIRVDHDGTPHILDFGLARTNWTPGAPASDLTLTTQFLGTLAYAAPEQATGQIQGIDTRTDVYALGVILYEMLDASLPYDTSGAFSAGLHAIEHADPRRLARRDNHAVDRSLEAIVFKALSKDPADRYQSVDALATDIGRYRRGDPIEARPETTAAQVRKLVLRHKAASALIAAVALLVVTLAVVSTAALSVIGAKEREARAEAQKVSQLAAFYESMFQSVRPDQAGRDVLVMDILDEAAGRLDAGLADSPEVGGFLHHALGHSYLLLGQYDKSIAHLERAVALKEEIGADAEEIVEVRADLASALSEVGQTERAEAIMRDAIEQLRHQPDPPPLLEAKLHGALGGAAVSRSDYVTAEPLLETAYRLRSETDGGDLMEIAAILNNLGMVKEMLTKYDEATALYREGLDLMSGDEREHVFARTHLLHNLANLEGKTGDLDEAERLFRESLLITRELYGPRHPGVASTMETLAAVLIDLNRLDEADEALAESLSIREEKLPAGHVKIASTIATIGELRFAQARYVEAETMARRARAMRVEQLDASHWLVGKADVRISRALLEQGQFPEARAFAVSGYDTMRADRDHGLAVRLGAVEQLCLVYEQWPTPDPDARRQLAELIEAQRAEADGAELAERLERCLERVRGLGDSG